MRHKNIIIIFTVIIIALSTALSVVAGITINDNIQHKNSVLDAYTMSCKEAQESLYDFSNNGNETSYTYLTSHINAMIGIVQLADDDFSINELNNDLIICHTYLIEAPEESKMHIDLLNESLLLYLNDANTEGAHIRLKAFNNRVHQELN